MKLLKTDLFPFAEKTGQNLSRHTPVHVVMFDEEDKPKEFHRFSRKNLATLFFKISVNQTR